MLLTIALFTLAASAAEPMKAAPLISLPGTSEAFDFMATDPVLDRVLAAHRGARTLEIIDLKTGKALPPTKVGAAQGIAMDATAHVYFVGNEADKTVVALDAKTLKKLWEVRVDGPVDAVAFDPTNQRVYAAEDDGNRVWAIDVKTKQLAEVVKIPGVPEMLDYDEKTDRIYVNIKDKDQIVRIDPSKNRVDTTWTTAPVVSPHGLVIDHAAGKLFTAGSNGKLAELDLASGKVTASAEIALGVDQIAFDEGERIVYSAGKGVISATQVTAEGLKALPNTPSPKGAHTIAVDSKRHEIWVCLKDPKHSLFQKFTGYTAP